MKKYIGIFILSSILAAFPDISWAEEELMTSDITGSEYSENSTSHGRKNLTNGLNGTIELQSSFSDGTTPLWLNANRHGLSSLESNNGYLRLKVERSICNDNSHKWGIGYSADIVGTCNYSSDFYIQQLFLKVRYKKSTLTFGQKEETQNLKPEALSSGSQTLGINSRPIPGVRFALDNYVDFFNGWMGIKGHFFYGMQTDGDFQKKHQTDRYNDNTLIHTKSGFLRIGKQEKPLTLEMGLEMATQFGGTTYWADSEIEKHDESLSAFIKAIYGGKNDKESGNYHSAEGNILGSWLMRLNYDQPTYYIGAYADHFFEDDSQMFLIDYDGYGKGAEWQEKKNNTYLLYPLNDIMVGMELRLKEFAPVNHFVVEYINTRYQSGPIYHDHSTYIPDHIGGSDNYMNHNTYGWSHWGQINGNPLYKSPIYDGNSLTTSCNRFKAWHIGIEGDPIENLHYRLLATWQKGWGTYNEPFSSMKRNSSFMAEIEYALQGRMREFSVKGAFGMDRGKLLGDNTGAQITIKWNGKICK